MRFLRQATASQEILLGPFVAVADGSAQTGLTIANTDIKLLYAGGTTENNKNSGGGTHIAGGRYSAVLDATDTGTVGILEVSVNPTAGIPWTKSYYVLEEAVYDALFAASAAGYGTAQTGDSFARLGAPAGASVSADIAAVSAKVDTVDDFLDTEIAAIKAKTDNLPSDPADASDIAASFATVNTKLDTIDDLVDTEIAAIKAKTDNLPSDPADQSLIIAATDAIMARIGTPVGADISADIAAVKADTAAILVDTGTTLDGKIDAIKVTTDKLDDTLEDQGGGVYGFTEAALQEAPTGGGGGPTAAEIADAVLDEMLSEHLETGSVGEALTDILTKTDNLPADPADASDIAASFATVNTKLDTIDDFLDTEVAAIKAKTDNLPSDPADASVVAGLIDALPTAAENATAVLAGVVEGTVTVQESLRLHNAAMGGKASGLETSTATYRDVGDTKDRIVATVDSDGNRTAVTLDLS